MSPPRILRSAAWALIAVLLLQMGVLALHWYRGETSPPAW